jgi:hypothetical protein
MWEGRRVDKFSPCFSCEYIYFADILQFFLLLLLNYVGYLTLDK